MPAVSRAQQHFFGMVHALKKGTLKMSSLPSSLVGKLQTAAKSISGKAAKDFAKTKSKKLPQHVTESVEFVLPEMSFKDYLIFEYTICEQITQEEIVLVETLLLEKKKPSAGLSKKKKHAIAMKAAHGKDIGKKGKNFKKVAAKAAKRYGSKEAGDKVAAAAMWKNARG